MEKTKRIGFYPGSFDPVTLGHLDIISRAAPLFDKLYIGVLVNFGKKTLFSAEERVKMLERVTRDLPNVEVISFSGLHRATGHWTAGSIRSSCSPTLPCPM